MFIENAGVHLHDAINTTVCAKHNVDIVVPCWSVSNGSGDTIRNYASICGSRIRRAGFSGKVTAQSLSTKSPRRFDNK